MSAELDRQRILDTALALAADRHWEAVRLYDVAAVLGVGLDALHPWLTEKEALVDWFWDRADADMLAQSQAEAFRQLEFPENFEACVLAWLTLPSAYPRSFREMLAVRMEPGHLHIQLPTLLRVSRSVQWMRECCRRDATFMRRALEETALSGVFLSTLAVWCGDRSQGFGRSHDFLRARLGNAVALGRLWPGDA
ncbi:TetR/AcrR family transcriptional regulator [Gammaproteobacteria bacterium AB-CW1]|uniref:TetR/AcrR family transcriptional regulator n=1 Tax=Natronospira elongata TaxID=3110268 RepID=A0AAP6JDW4_9GAMM|nr:TetR/AcrR family transcriptional regulator [Gammaproteobacteria bacterium AB-CW1]